MKILDLTPGEWVGRVGSLVFSLGLTVGMFVFTETRPTWALAGVLCSAGWVMIAAGPFISKGKSQ